MTDLAQDDLPDEPLLPAPLEEAELAVWERSGPRRERHQVAVAIRDAFLHLEAALSMADPNHCAGVVGPAVASEVQARVEQLRRDGHRRIHGLLEVGEVTITRATGPIIDVIVEATSSLHEVDAAGRVVAGSTDLMHWHQPLTAEQSPPDGDRWVITTLGLLHTGAVVSGPLGEPMDPERAAAWERHMRDEGRREESLRVAAGSLIAHI